MKSSTLRTVLTLVAVGVLLAVVLPWMRTQVKIDGCLDSGGRWSGETERCEWGGTRGGLKVDPAEREP